MANNGSAVLKVAWDNCLAQRDQAGTGVYAARLLEQLVKRADLRMEVFHGWSASWSHGALRTSANLLYTHAYLPWHLRNWHFDLLHAPAFIAPIACPCRVVITIHDITYLLYPAHFAKWWVAYMKLAMPPIVKSASAIICGSEHSKRDIVKAYGIKCEKVHVVPYGVEHRRFHRGAVLNHQWARAIGIRNDGYLLHVGTFSYRKNIPTLLRAIANLRSKGKWGNRQLVLAGSATAALAGAGEIHDAIQQLDLEHSVVLAGRVPDEYLPGLYAAAGLLVMPSLYEGFGFPVLESMAVGTPVVASDNSSLPEVTGDAAILFPPFDENALANAIADIIENRSTAEELRTKGLARASQFSWQRAAEETVAVYRSVAKF
jgi:glycosyltransferase involved in cell wall biosynthesis